MTYQEIQQTNLILFHGIRGSQLYGLETPESDVDTYQIFCAPQDWIYGTGCKYLPQISDQTNDNTASELGKYFKELQKSNPDALISLWTPPKFIIYKSPLLDPLINIRETLLTKECFKSFRGYAKSQIGKARGLQKAMNISPEEVKERKTPLDFSWVHIPGSQDVWTLRKWLGENKLQPEYCGLVRLSNGIEYYALFYDWGADKTQTQENYQRFREGSLSEVKEIGYRGCLIDRDSTQLRLSAIPKAESKYPLISFQYNMNAFSSHCRKYKEYWEWVNHRNPVRYKTNLGHSYDSKNCSHCIRLLTMASEIASGKGLILDRREAGDRGLLLDVKNHKFSYEEVMKLIREAEDRMEESFSLSTLPDSPDIEKLEEIMIGIRREFYRTLDSLK